MGNLHEQMKADLTLKGYSPHTFAGYLPRCREFAQDFNRSPIKRSAGNHIKS